MYLKNKRIIFAIVSMEKGGAERVVATLANELCILNEVTIITLVEGGIAYELNENIKVVSLADYKIKTNNFLLKKIVFLPNLLIRYFKMRHFFKEIIPNIIISFLPESSFLASMANRKKYKLIISDRNDPKKEYASFPNRFLMKKYYKNADGFVFQTEEAKSYFDKYINFSKKKYAVIANPVNALFINAKYKNPHSKRIIAIGRLCEQKNYGLLIEAFARISNLFPDYVLNIYGEGPLRETIQKKIHMLNLENKVFLKGITNEVVQELLNSELFVLSSNYEGIPNVLVEAMTLGLPVISTDCPCGGPKTFIEQGINGYLTPVGDVEAMAKRIEMLLKDESIREKIGKNASKILQTVHPEVIYRQWEKFILAILDD